MDRESIIEEFETLYGYTPTEEELMDILGQNYQNPYSSRTSSSRYLSDNSLNNRVARSLTPADDLLSQIGDTFSSIASSAKKACSTNNMNTNTNKEQLFFMTMIFGLKTGLYFVLKSSYEKGYDFKNL